ncbi:cytosine permease [Caldalkalibacillus uzonensis]|uniref:Cytosine permease n=1 Tax=Caldalkalibacillus uzonensis TaxID=353224 RepID=A0ABU0CYF5_9BACI|nr:cytosine permease [Caldalkalibacillus uzonensis]MDQ0341170.1 cytosine permease [Caldalkalibacillus uzonensis]
MSEEKVKLQLNDNALNPVPEEERRPWWEITFVTSGFCLAVSGMFAGAAIAAGLTIQQVIAAILIGNLVLALYGGFTGGIGAKTGVSTAMLSRYAFGRFGSLVISLLWAITLVGWFSVQTGFFGQTIHAMFPEGGFLTSAPVAAAWGGALMIFTAYFGFCGIRFLSNIVIPLLLILSVVGVVKSISYVGGWANIPQEVADPMTLIEAVVLVVGTFAVGAVIQPDITRYAKSAKDAWIAIIIGMVIANGFIIFAGAITARAMGTGDLPAVMLQLGLGLPALIVLIAAQWTSNDSNLYSASLSVSNMIRVERSKVALVVGIIATILGAAGFANYFVNWLSALGVAIPPIAGILIADYYFVHKQNYRFGKDTTYNALVWPAFIAWVIGILAGLYVQWGIPSLNSLVAAFLAHWLLFSLGKSINLQMSSGTVKEKEDGF